MRSAQGIGALAGSLQLRPGAVHSLVSRRPTGLVRALRGQPAAALPGLLASLFSACGAVHRLGADLALRAATSGSTVQPDAAQRRLLQWHTLRAHLQAITLDWPRLLAGGDDGATQAGLALLAGCPLRRAGSAPDATALAALPDWLQAQVFHQPLPDWLTAWQAGPAAALRSWADRHASASAVASWLQRSRPIASQPLPAVPPLRAHADADRLRALIDEALATSPGPTWQGRCADTGPATRLAQPPQALPTAWLRLGARLADLARLALPDDDEEALGCHGLALGALPLSADAAAAWVETSRGLLLQALWLAPGAVGAMLHDALVLSPTDWHSHPAGGFAQALAALPGDAPAAAVQALVAAYDPCVPCVIDTLSMPLEEAHHA